MLQLRALTALKGKMEGKMGTGTGLGSKWPVFFRDRPEPVPIFHKL